MLCRCPGMTISPLPAERVPETGASLYMSAPYIVTYSVLSLPSGDLCPPPLSFHRHLRGQLRGRWEGTVCPQRGTVGGLSSRWPQLSLLRGGTLSNRDKHLLCWGSSHCGVQIQWGTLSDGSPGFRTPCPAERKGRRHWWPQAGASP